MSYFFPNYDVIVIGGGHAGCEAAASAANMGCKVLLVSMSLRSLGQMSCNPAMGGIAKGQIVREIDALGGYSGIISDKTAIQFKMLNQSKGPAMWSPRTQNDRVEFSLLWRKMLENTLNLDFWQGMVKEVLIKNNKAIGIITELGHKIYSNSVILTSGTFMNGIIHVGEKNTSGGRVGERHSYGITEQLVSLGFESGRMKTGTPPRLDGRSLDYSKMEVQPGDENPAKFSFSNYTKPLEKQLDCYLTYTNEKVHEILKKGFHLSPMFQGRIKGIGPRYCPSIEDKINRFADKKSHQLFIEPEGWNTVEIYLNGFSTSLDYQTQFEALKAIKGLENVKVFTPGYAIEYDYFPPTQLTHTLETKNIESLYFAGQINGTTGYEEAACQGLISGINASLKIKNKPPFILNRDEAYIGVLIDDLVTKGTDEPYRMFTSRAEFRILLRQDNADIRLTKKGYDIGLAKEDRYKRLQEKIENTNKITNIFLNKKVTPTEINPYLEEIKTPTINETTKIERILLRPQVEIKTLKKYLYSLNEEIELINDEEATIEAEISIKYKNYLEKEQENANKYKKNNQINLPKELNYSKINSISFEAREKLNKIKPLNLRIASNISGVSPSDITAIKIYLSQLNK